MNSCLILRPLDLLLTANLLGSPQRAKGAHVPTPWVRMGPSFLPLKTRLLSTRGHAK